MTKVFLILAVFVVLLIAIFIITWRRRTGKSREVREQYAFRCVVLLIGLAGDTICALTSGYTFVDVAAAFLGIEIQESLAVTVVTKLLVVLVFFATLAVVVQTYRRWDGPVSRRQHQMDMRMEESSLFLDFLVALTNCFTRTEGLAVYHKLQTAEQRQWGEIVGDPPWHVEFAEIYNILSNQAHIRPAEDWHPQASCLISSYADGKKIAVYCTETLPDRKAVDDFLGYIHQYHANYLQILVAIKLGRQPDFSEDRGALQIRYLFKENALDGLVDFSGYRSAICRLYQSPLMQGTSLRIEDVYVGPRCRLGKDGPLVELEEYVTYWLEEEGNRHLALLGDFGQGKTLFSLYLTRQLMDTQGARFPILIPLRNKSPRNSDESEIFSYFAAHYGIDPAALRILNNNGRLLLIFDGFDEMDLIGNDDIRKQHFRSLWKLVHPRSKVLITGRPNYFFSPGEMASALGFQAGNAGIPRCDPLYLQSFDRDQILLALRHAKPSVQNGIRYILDKQVSASFLDLISRPSHLFLVSQIWEERHIAEKFKNLTSATIINEFLQNCFERQQKKGTADPYFYLSPVEREYFMTGVAVYLYKLGMVSIPQDTFSDLIVDLLDLFPERLSEKNPAALNLRGGRSLRAFAQKDDNALLAVINDVRTCGLLVNDMVTSGLCFAHKSFFDLLVAKFYLGRELRLYDDTMYISQALSRSAAFHPRLKNDLVVRKLLAELISAQVTLRMSGANEGSKCRKLFVQCRKALSYRGFHCTPQKLLLRSREEPEIRQTVAGRQRDLKYKRRLLLLYCMAVGTAVVFLVKGAQFVSQYRDAADQYFAQFDLPEAVLGTEALPANFRPYWLLLLGCLLLLVVLALLCRKIALTLSEKAGLVLLTWYYACRESGISQKEILQQFPPKYSEMFLDFIQGNSLTELQEQAHRTLRRHKQRTARN